MLILLQHDHVLIKNDNLIKNNSLHLINLGQTSLFHLATYFVTAVPSLVEQ